MNEASQGGWTPCDAAVARYAGLRVAAVPGGVVGYVDTDSAYRIACLGGRTVDRMLEVLGKLRWLPFADLTKPFVADAESGSVAADAFRKFGFYESNRGSLSRFTLW